MPIQWTRAFRSQAKLQWPSLWSFENLSGGTLLQLIKSELSQWDLGMKDGVNDSWIIQGTELKMTDVKREKI